MTQTDEQRDRRELSEGAIRDRLSDVEIGDQVLFNDRKTPLDVKDIDGRGRILIEGPQGGEYELWPEAQWVQNNPTGPRFNPAHLRWVEVVEDK
jgi:hypothetical protein